MLCRRFLLLLLLASGLHLLARSAPLPGPTASSAAPAPRLVLLHPTRANLEIFFWLLDHGLLRVPAPTIVGLYHEQEEYDYAAARAWAAANPARRVSFVSVATPLAADQLYRRHAGSDTFAALVRDSDGMIFWGGPDLPPAYYGRRTHLLTDITDPARHALELSLLFHLLGGTQDPAWRPLLAAKPAYPVFGFCLGMQSMNVATGGTMTQDIPFEIYGRTHAEDVLAQPTEEVHRNYWKMFGPDDRLTGGKLHRIRLRPEGLFVREFGCAADLTPAVYSSHHQAVDRLGAELEVLATSLDGRIVEALRHRRFRRVLGVQFHPEILALYGGPGPSQYAPDEKDPAPLEERLRAGGGEAFHRAYWDCVSAWLRAPAAPAGATVP